MARRRAARVRSATTKLTTPALAVALAVNSTAKRGGGRDEQAVAPSTTQQATSARSKDMAGTLARHAFRFNHGDPLAGGLRARRAGRARSPADSARSPS